MLHMTIYAKAGENQCNLSAIDTWKRETRAEARALQLHAVTLWI